MIRVIDIIRAAVGNGVPRSVAVKKNIIMSVALKCISVAVTFMLVPVTIGYVNSEIYGVWLTLATMLTWFQFLDIGLTPGLKNKLTEAIAHGHIAYAKSLVSTTYFAMAAIFTPLAIIGYCAVPYVSWTALLNVNSVYETEISRTMQLLSVLVCLQMTANVIVSVLAAFQRVAYSQSFIVVGNLVSLLVIMVLSKTTSPSLPLLAMVLAGMPILVTIIASICLYSTRYKSISPSAGWIRPKYISGLFSLGVKFFVINAQAVVVYQSTNLLISHVSSPEVVTGYNIAYKYLSVAMLLYSTITVPLWPAYTDAYAKGDLDWMRRMRRKMLKILGLCAVICVIFAVISDPVYTLWIGDKAIVPPLMTWMVTLYVISYCFMTLSGTFIVGIGKVLLESIVVVIGAVVYIPCALMAAGWLQEYGILCTLVAINLAYGIIFDMQTRKIISGTATGLWNK